MTKSWCIHLKQQFPRKLERDSKLRDRSRELRSNATKQENHLWYDYLKQRPERWYRQKIIGGFIVDFYCPKAKLVVELDGMHHLASQQHAYDVERSAYLEGQGLTVLRFLNWETDEMFFNVCRRIAEKCELY